MKIKILKFFLKNHYRSLEGVLDKLNSKNLVEGVNKEEINANEYSDSDQEENDWKNDKNSLPGAKVFDISKRNIKLRIEARQIIFSPAEDAWCVASCEGLHVY